MEQLSILTLLLISSGMIFIITARYYSRIKELDAFCFFSLAYLLYYFITPTLVIVLLKYKVTSHERFSFKILNASYDQHIFAILISLLGYIFFYILFKLCKRIKVRLRNVDFQDRKFIQGKEISTSKYNLIKMIAWLVFIIGFSAELYLIYNLGGISNSFTMIEPLRSGSIEKSIYIPNNMLFIFTIYPWIHAATFLFFLAYRIKKTNMNLIIFIVSMCSSLYALLLSGGRTQIILFIICFFYDYVRKKYKHYLFAMILISIIILASLTAMENLFFYLTYGYIPIWSVANITSIVEEFAFPYANLLNVRLINEIYGLRYGIDFIGWVTYLVPSKVLSLLGVERVEHGYNLISQFYNGVNSYRGSVPTDSLTLGYRQFGILGIYFTMLFYSMICAIINRIADKIKDKEFSFIYIRMCMLLFIMVPYADIENFVRSHFSTLILIVVVNIVFSENNSFLKEV